MTSPSPLALAERLERIVAPGAIIEISHKKTGELAALIAEAAQALRQMAAPGWRPISEYDAMHAKKRPRLAAFRFAPTLPSRPSAFGLPVHFALERNFGRRVCTHFYELPSPETTAGKTNE